MRAFKEQVARNLSYNKVPSLVDTITHNIEVGEGGHSLNLRQLISYALFAQGLPGGHLFQEKIENVVCGIECQASSSAIAAAVDRFQNPDVTEPTAAVKEAGGGRGASVPSSPQRSAA